MTRAERMRAQVAKGAADLDRLMPGWYHAVDVTDLNMHSCTRCVLGHVFGTWGVGVMCLGCSRDGVGVDTHALSTAYGAAFAGNEYAPLWVEAIAGRLYPDPVAAPVYAEPVSV